MKPHYTVNPPTYVRVSDMEILHAGLGVLMATSVSEPVIQKNRALQISQQFRVIADHPELPDDELRPLYRTLAAYWHFRSFKASD